MVTGKVFKFGDNVDTDVIIPANTSTHHHLQSWLSTVWKTSTLNS